MGILSNFFKGLKKSFDGKDHLREIHQCELCGKPSWSLWCQWCELKANYDKSNKIDNNI